MEKGIYTINVFCMKQWMPLCILELLYIIDIKTFTDITHPLTNRAEGKRVELETYDWVIKILKPYIEKRIDKSAEIRRNYLMQIGWIE